MNEKSIILLLIESKQSQTVANVFIFTLQSVGMQWVEVKTVQIKLSLIFTLAGFSTLIRQHSSCLTSNFGLNMPC